MQNDIQQQDAEQAVPFTTAFDIPEIIQKQKATAESLEDIASRQQELLIEGSDTEFWQLLKAHLESRIRQLHSAQSLRLGTGKLDLQEIGFKAVIINEVADGLQSVINLVENAKKKRLATIADQEQKEGE